MKLYTYSIAVVRVIDGDTLLADIDLGFHTTIREFIRLYDVDTPETFGRYAEERGKLATAFTTDWLRGADRDVYATGFVPDLLMDSRRYDPRGKYGRCLGEVYRPGDPVSLNAALIAAGHVK